jgi:hypothetical protein
VNAPRICTRCSEAVWNTQPARITAEGTSHLGGCDPGAGEATDRMKAAFAAANQAKVRV